jgi:predicted Rossmann fold flavoprotein
MSQQDFRVVIVGSGPAGLMAAISAARHGARVTLCEQLDRPGTKLLATGGGHCNFTNTLPAEELARRFGRQGRFMLPALEMLPPDELRRFFEELGIPSICPDGFHIFPASNRAADILQALLGECRRLGVVLELGLKVTELRISQGRLRGVRTSRGELSARAIVIATGGKGYPGLGGTGGGYALAEQAGHALTDPTPALVGLTCSEAWPGSCAGLTLPEVSLWLDLPKRRSQISTGDMLFTHSGISGPSVIDLSGDVAELLTRQESVPLRFACQNTPNRAQWEQQFADWQRREGKKLVRTLLAQTFPRSLTEALCRLAGIAPNTIAAEFTRAGRETLAGILPGIPLTISGTGGFPKAMVTRGGVKLKKVNPLTLESRLTPGVFLAGEVLDLDGPCGGYNLQWAFSSGCLAGAHCLDHGGTHID